MNDIFGGLIFGVFLAFYFFSRLLPYLIKGIVILLSVAAIISFVVFIVSKIKEKHNADI